MKRQFLLVVAVAVLSLSGCRNGPWWRRGAACSSCSPPPCSATVSPQFDPYGTQASVPSDGSFVTSGCPTCQPGYYGDTVDGGGFVPREGAVLPDGMMEGATIQGGPMVPADLPPTIPGAPAPTPAAPSG